MKTNFKHLGYNKKYYAMARTMEDQMVHMKNQTQLKMVGNTIRQIMEALVRDVAQKYGVCSEGRFSEVIYRLEKEKVIAKEVAKNWRGFLTIGNDCSHPKKKVTEAQLEKIYKILYEESYRIVKYYLTDEALVNHKKQKEKDLLEYIEKEEEKMQRRKAREEREKQERQERREKEEKAAAEYRAKREERRRLAEEQKRKNAIKSGLLIGAVLGMYFLYICYLL